MSHVTEQLRDKIKSKMEVAKFFSGFITLLIGVLLGDGASAPFWSRLGILFLVASLGYCIAAVFAYDRILMPADYWTSLSPSEKEESYFNVHLHAAMIQSWSWLFVPAVACFGIGFFFTLFPLLRLTGFDIMPHWAESLILGFLLVLAVVLPVVVNVTKGPQIYRGKTDTDENRRTHASTGRPASPSAR